MQRRNFLVALGLAPTALIGAETMVKSSDESDLVVVPSDRVDAVSMARAFRELADGIEKGEILVRSFEVHSSIRADEIMAHELKTEICFKV